MRKWLLVVVLAVLAITPSVMAQKLLIVTDAPDLEVEGAGNLGDYLRSANYTVDVDLSSGSQTDPASNSRYRGELTAEKIAELESYDLVIVHRSTSSGDFNNGNAKTQWNELKVPILMGSAYLPRTERWQWTTAAQQRTNWDAILVKDTSHPIFTGMGEEIFIYQFPLDIDHLSTTDMGNGKVLATVMKSDGTEGTFAAEWPSSGFFIGSSGQMHTYPRVYMAFFRYHETDSNGGFVDYTEDGKTLIKNAVAYTLSLAPAAMEEWTLY